MSSKVTQVCEFECCYLIGTELNAHRYKLEITVMGPQHTEDCGKVIDFSVLLKYMFDVVPDKCFLFDTSSQNIGREVAFILGQRNIKICGCFFTLSAENICNDIVHSLQDILNTKEPGVQIVSARLRETPSSFVSWSIDSESL